MNKHEYTGERPFWYDGKMVNEVGFCEDFLQKHPMVRVGGSFFTKDGRITDEESVRKEIYEMLRPYLNCGLAKRASGLLEMVKLEAYVPNLPVHEDRLHVANGTLFLNGEFTDQKEFCRNRLPVKYDANAPQPVTWLHFLSELLEDEDVLTLQEYLGYTYKELTAENATLEQKLNSASRESIQKKLEIQRKLSELDELRRTVDAIPDEVIRAYSAQRSAHHSRIKQEI